MDYLAAVGAAAAVAGGVLVHARLFPYGPCPACTGHRGRGRGSSDKAWNRCRRCGGRGERVRPVSRVFKVWRDEDRARKGK